MPLTTAGRAASSTDRSTWCSYRQARDSRIGAGLGFVLDGDGVVCLDLDHCVDGRGGVAAWARQVLDRLPATYIEVSASGTGLHVFGFGFVERGRHVRVDGGTVEVYGWGRYIAVTGDRFTSAPARLADISEAIASLI
jgi:primase-polymerase (primpol)-like protein